MKESQKNPERNSIDPIVDGIATEIKEMIGRLMDRADLETKIRIMKILTRISGQLLTAIRDIESIDELELSLNRGQQAATSVPLDLLAMDQFDIIELLNDSDLTSEQFVAIYQRYKTETGYSDAKIAELTGCSKGYLSLLINGKRSHKGNSEKVRNLLMLLREHFRIVATV